MINIPNEIKALFKQDSVRKNFRVHFPNGEMSDLTNENVVTESVSFTESLCSRDKFKFGLCEASTIQFEVVGTKNMKGMAIECSLDIDVSSLDVRPEGCEQKEDLDYPSYSMPYGLFVVDSCQKQPDMEHRVVVAYSNENFIDYMIPASIWELKGYTWLNNETLNFSLNDLLDLTFPSHSYNRKIMHDSRELGEDERILKTECMLFDYDTETSLNLVYEVMHMANADYNNCLFTFRTVYDKEKYRKSLNELKQKYGFDNNDKLIMQKDTIWETHKPGTPFLYSFGTAYAKITESRGLITQLEGTPEGYAYIDNFELDSNPYTFFKQYRYRTASGGVHYELGYIIKPRPSDPTKYIYWNDEAGTIVVPAYLEVHRGAETLEQIELGHFEYFRENIKNTDGLITMQSVESFRNLWNLVTLTEKVTPTVRSDPSYRNNVILNIEAYNWRDIIESAIELNGKIGHYNRKGFFELREIDMKNALYPSETLYPNFGIFPRNMGGANLTRSIYQSAWYDDNVSKPIRYITCDKPSGGTRASYKYEIPVQMFEKGIPIETYFEEISEGSAWFRLTEGTYEDNKPIIIDCDVPFSRAKLWVYAMELPPWEKEDDDPERWKHPYFGLDIDISGKSIVIDNSNENMEFILRHLSGLSSVILEFDNIESGIESIEISEIKTTQVYADDDGVAYDISDNHFIKNVTHNDDQLDEIFKKIGEKVGGLQYTPSSVTCMGQPYIEVGDWINIVGQKDAFDSLILERTIQGIQTLTDSYESKGE